MTETLTEKETSTLTLRVRFPEPANPISINEMSLKLSYVQALIFVGAFISLRTTHFEGLEEDRATYSPRELAASDEFPEARYIASQFKIHKLTYGSPIDMFLIVSGSVGLAFASAYKVVDLWSKVCDLRVKKTATEFQVEVNQQMLKELKMDYEMRSVPGKERMEQIVDRASNGAIEAEIIEVIENPER